MIIPCFRCSKGIDTPDSSNADYVIAPDMLAKEPREVFVAFKHNQATLAKQTKMAELNPDGTPKYPALAISDSEYDSSEVLSIKTARQSFGEDLVKVETQLRDKDIQKTGIICPGCHRPGDFIIWGVHKT